MCQWLKWLKSQRKINTLKLQKYAPQYYNTERQKCRKEVCIFQHCQFNSNQCLLQCPPLWICLQIFSQCDNTLLLHHQQQQQQQQQRQWQWQRLELETHRWLMRMRAVQRDEDDTRATITRGTAGEWNHLATSSRLQSPQRLHTNTAQLIKHLLLTVSTVNVLDQQSQD